MYRHPPPVFPSLPVAGTMDNDWQSLSKLIEKVGKIANPSTSEDALRKAGWIINLLGSNRELPAATAPVAKPRALTPLEAPEGSNEVDTSGVPQSYFAKNAQAESGNRSDAKNPWSGASGRYQFLPSTWRSLMKSAPELGLTEEGITDDAQQDRAMRYYTARSANALRPILGRDPTGGELYMLHLFGQTGGSNVMQNLDKPLRGLFDQRVFDWNPMLKDFTTGRQLLSAFNKRFS